MSWCDRKTGTGIAIGAGAVLLLLAGGSLLALVGYGVTRYAASREQPAAPVTTGRIELNQPNLPPVTAQPATRPCAPLRTARQQVGIVAGDGRVYAIGGLRYAPVEFLHTVESYDPELDTWRDEAPMPEAHVGMAAAVVDGEIYVIGGSRGGPVPLTGAMHIYNPQTRQWRSGPPLPAPRTSMCAAALDGLIYVIGGQSPGTLYSRVDVYDTVRGTWSRGPDLQTPRYCAAAVAFRDSIMVLGGESNDSENARHSNPYELASVEILTPGQRAWQAGPDLPLACIGPAAAVADDRVLLFGGCGEGGYRYYNHVFALDDGIWTPLPPLAGVRAHGGATVVDGRIFVAGGVDVPRAGQLDTVEEYLHTLP